MSIKCNLPIFLGCTEVHRPPAPITCPTCPSQSSLCLHSCLWYKRFVSLSQSGARADTIHSRLIPAHTAIPVGPPCPCSSGEREWKLGIPLFKHLVMSNYPGSRRGSAPPPYTFGPSPSIPSPARILHHRIPGYNLTPPNAPDRRQYGSEPAPLSYSEGTRRRRGAIPPYGTSGQDDLERPSRVFSDHRPSVGSLYKPPETRLGYSPPLYESDPVGIDKFKDEDDINFNILRKCQHQFSSALQPA